jgi:uncharacterized surface protein with fasciclin (FAS1) repeats
MKRIGRVVAVIGVTAVAATAMAACGSSSSSSSSSSSASSTPAMTAAAPGASTNLVQTAVAAGQFKTLAALLTKAGLADTLATGGPYTVFAPTDEAFAKVPKATLDGLAGNPEQLKAVLLYHVVPGKVMAADAMKLSSAKTLNGKPLMLSTSGSELMVDGATVTSPDVAASNGVIHVINTVLIP